ncbi:MAG: MMPL family transporter [Halobacteriovoraceae bacterium]|jgi:uncharacterized protein|nr:MMPL family transporter [Halobacteriovoraceae bacterium]MBT5092960.1 MMPL family transporter [Halobacteriovoraceae bacterium]
MKISNWLLKILILASGSLIILLSVYLSTKTHPHKVTYLLRADHPVRLAYEKYEKKYNDENDLYLLVVKEKSVFTAGEISSLGREIRREFGNYRGVKSVTSFENAEYMTFSKNTFSMQGFIADKKWREEGQKQLEYPHWYHTFSDGEKDNFLISVRLTDIVSGKLEKKLLTELFSYIDKLRSQNENIQFHFLGTKAVKYHFLQEMIRNQQVITPLLMLLLAALIYLLFKSFYVLFWFFFVMFIGYAGTMILIIICEKGINPYSGMALFFVLIVSTSDLIHFFSNYLKFQSGSVLEKIKLTKEKVFWPCLLTSVTTAIGFASLIGNEMAPVMFFGIYCTFGSLLCFVLTFYLLPAILELFKFEVKLAREIPKFKIDKVMNYFINHPKRIFYLFIISLFPLIYGATQLKIDDDFYNKFYASHPLSKAVKVFEKRMNYLGSIDLIINTKDRVLNLENRKKLKSLEEELIKIPDVTFIKSFSSIYQYIEKVVSLGGAKTEASSEIEKRVDSIFNLLNNYQLFKSFYNLEANEVKSTVFLKTTSSKDLRAVLDAIKGLSSREEFSNLSIRPMGFVTIRTTLLEKIIGNFLVSFGISFVIIFFIFLLIFKSFKWAALAMLPNLYPLLFIAGLMGLFGLSIEGNLVILVCISFAIAVDDTIHFLWTFQKNLKEGKGHQTSLNLAFTQTSSALLGTTLVFVLSFPCFFLADLKLFIQIGGFVMGALILALLADFLLLPALFQYFGPGKSE